MVEENIPNFNLDGIELNAIVCSIYDGDTITAIFPFPETKRNYKWKCRLSGIDTPEIKTKNEKEKCKGKEIRDILRSKILNKEVKLKCGKMDKYGRILVNIYYENICINDWLLENNYAQLYNGGTKKQWNF